VVSIGFAVPAAETVAFVCLALAFLLLAGSIFERTASA
ncbi:MAG: hypothetical protein QOJ65_2328, partial [Fimbriimonadaceae bacterium]|nr:hypothetical protein [Fimbriimonadaceae bacterium]